MKKFNKFGFTLIELMIVVAIIALLAMVAVPSYLKHVGKAKRSEAHINLGAIYMAEKTYHAEHGTYTDKLTSPDSLGFKVEGEANYTYGFPGQEGVNFITGKLKAPGSSLAGAKADKDTFTVAAAADIDGDGQLDILTINEKREIKIVKNDLE